jgi:hypothetical protein
MSQRIPTRRMAPLFLDEPGDNPAATSQVGHSAVKAINNETIRRISSHSTPRIPTPAPSSDDYYPFRRAVGIGSVKFARAPTIWHDIQPCEGARRRHHATMKV